jgi:hypothetical protein
MARYEYEGPGPHDDGGGGIVRPGDVREFAEEPDWGPWRPLGGDAPDGAEKPAAVPATQAPAPAPVSPPTASTPAPAPKQGE